MLLPDGVGCAPAVNVGTAVWVEITGMVGRGTVGVIVGSGVLVGGRVAVGCAARVSMTPVAMISAGEIPGVGVACSTIAAQAGIRSKTRMLVKTRECVFLIRAMLLFLHLDTNAKGAKYFFRCSNSPDCCVCARLFGRGHIEDKFQFFAFFVVFGEVDYIAKIMKFIAFDVKDIKGAGVPGFFAHVKQYPFAVKFIARLEGGAI